MVCAVLGVGFCELMRFFIFGMQGKDKTTEERRIAICIFDDIVEHCREAALRWIP